MGGEMKEKKGLWGKWRKKRGYGENEGKKKGLGKMKKNAGENEKKNKWKNTYLKSVCGCSLFWWIKNHSCI